jgi:hypothetical protein
MKTLKMTVELTYDDTMWHRDDEEDRAWFFNEVLLGADLQLGDVGDVGDMIGDIKVLTVEES